MEDMNGTKVGSRRLLLVAATVALALLLILPGSIGIAGADGASLFVPFVSNQVAPTPDPGWLVQYYGDRYLTGSPVHTEYKDVPHPEEEWGEGAPVAGMSGDEFSVRYTRNVWFDAGQYRFALTVDDGGSLYIDGARVIYEWHGSDRGTASYVYDATFSAGGYHEIKVEYFEWFGEARVRCFWVNRTLFPDWVAEYWNNESLSGDPVLVQNRTQVSQDWGTGSPGSGVQSDYWSARYTRVMYLDGDGVYVFRLTADDGGQVWIDKWAPGQATIDRFSGSSAQTFTELEILQPGWYVITVTYHEVNGAASIEYDHLFGGTTYGLRTAYYASQFPTGTPVWVGDESFDQSPPPWSFFRDWGAGAPNKPDATIPSDYFSAVWTHVFEGDPGKYRFIGTADDGFRLWVDGELLTVWGYTGSGQTSSLEADLTGTHHVVRIEYTEAYGDASIQMDWYRQ